MNILYLPRRRYIPPSGYSLFIPGRGQVSIGRSPNLIAWNGAAPSTGWSGTRVTLSNETTPTPPVSAKVLKGLCNDAAGAGTSKADIVAVGYLKYAGITATFKAYCQCPSGNALTQEIGLYSVTTTLGSAIAKNDAWGIVSLSKKLPAVPDALVASLRFKVESTANTTDILYVDVPDLYVPQIILPNGQIVYSDQSGIGSNGLLTFDGIDDLVILMQATQWNGTGAFSWMGWITPTGWGGGSTGRILHNGILSFNISSNSGGSFLVYSDNATGATSGVTSIVLNKRQWIGLTRAADGTVNFYTEVNGLPTLSGSANQASGTPVAGTSNLIGGNRVAGDRGFAGNPFDNSVLMLRIATMAEMTAHIEGTRYS